MSDYLCPNHHMYPATLKYNPKYKAGRRGDIEVYECLICGDAWGCDFVESVIGGFALMRSRTPLQ